MLRYQFATPEKALDHLLTEGEKSYRGTAHIWIEHKNISGGNDVIGAKSITRKMLEGRIYSVNWCNEIVSIRFLDAAWMDTITGRSYPDQTRCQVVRFPSNEVVTC